MSYLSAAQRAQLRAIREDLDVFVRDNADVPNRINGHMSAIRQWKPAAYAIGDVRMYGGNPYKCVQAHDSAENAAWNPEVASLWTQYHGTTPETARPWIAPSGAQDMYRAGEYMIWTDGVIYRAVMDTAYSPGEYGQAWNSMEK